MRKTYIFLFSLIIVISAICIYFFFNSNSEKIEETVHQNIPTSADNAPLGSMHNLPVPDAVKNVKMHVATLLGIDEGTVIIMSAYEKTWTNGCLDLAKEGEMCTEALVEGYEITVHAQGKEFVYHTNEDGSIIREQ